MHKGAMCYEIPLISIQSIQRGKRGGGGGGRRDGKGRSKVKEVFDWYNYAWSIFPVNLVSVHMM